MRQEILSKAAKKSIFFSEDALEMILSNNDPMEFTNTVFSHLANNMMFVNRQDIMDAIAGDKVLFESEKAVKRHNKFTPDIHVVKGTDITGESTSEGKINDFAQYFKSRFFSLKRLIEKRQDFGRAIEYGQRTKRKKHVSPDDIQTHIVFGDDDREIADYEVNDWEGEHRQTEDLINNE